tara:strand:+ start:6486 stop:6770 length:285 start_codon:yes stop_codon:yes gene_type:complete
MVKIGNFFYERSTRKGKKLMTRLKGGKVIHFGDAKAEQYRDATGYWKMKDHNDKKRQASYLARAKGIKNKKGELTWKDPTSPNYHATRILWAGK